MRLKSVKVNITTEFCIFKLEGNDYISHAGSDALVYLAKKMHKQSFTTFAWGNPFTTYVCNSIATFLTNLGSRPAAAQSRIVTKWTANI